MPFASRVVAGSPAIDPETIEQLRFLEDESQPNVVAELVGLFIEHTPPKIESMLDAIAKSDAGALKRAAHSLKGSSANVGATGMRQVCEQLEHGAAAGSLEDAPRLVSLLQDEFAVVRQALAAEI